MIVALYVLLAFTTILYVVAFSYETFLSIRPIGNPSVEYAHQSWEITHTLLVIVLTVFVNTHSPVLPDIALVIFWPLFIAMFGFIARAGLYLYLFFIRDQDDEGRHSAWPDMLFALTHLVVLGGLAPTVVLSVLFLLDARPEPLTSSLAWFIPGFVLTYLACAIPIFRLYKFKGY